LQSERLHEGLSTESLAEVLLNAGPEAADVMSLPRSEAERNLLATVLLKDDEELSSERLEGAVRALRRIHLRRKLDQVQQELQNTRNLAADRLRDLLQEKTRLKRSLMDPNLQDPPGDAA
jgi:hypothetical protein